MMMMAPIAVPCQYGETFIRFRPLRMNTMMKPPSNVPMIGKPANILGRYRIGRLPQEGCEAARKPNILVLRVGSQAAHRHVFHHALPQRMMGRSIAGTGIGSSSHDEGNSMLERQLRPAQDFIENAHRY
jgi:hypothetical protein